MSEKLWVPKRTCPFGGSPVTINDAVNGKVTGTGSPISTMSVTGSTRPTRFVAAATVQTSASKRIVKICTKASEFCTEIVATYMPILERTVNSGSVSEAKQAAETSSHLWDELSSRGTRHHAPVALANSWSRIAAQAWGQVGALVSASQRTVGSQVAQ